MTSNFPSFPSVPGSGLIDSISKKATSREYIGVLADADAKSLITRSFNLTKEEAAAVDRVVGNPQTLYISQQDFVRHAVWELLQAYVEAGFPDEYIADVTNHAKVMRESAHRLRLRQEFGDVLHVYETAINDGLETGDFDMVDATLATLEGYVDRTPEPHWKLYLRRIMLKSGVIHDAVRALHEYTSSSKEGRARKDLAMRADRWYIWLEGLAD